MGKKFINPVEKARKQAKKKELNKQKKQRFEARNVNLKGKDPQQIITELERLDKIQYNIEEPPKLNEKVIENKRQKLKETWYRILSVYKKDDQARYTQIKRLEMEYEANRVLLIKKYDAVKSAKEVNLEEIPLPFCSDEAPTLPTNSRIGHDITVALTKSNLREPQKEYLTIAGELRDDLKPPGCPSAVPPSIEELEEDAKCAKESKNTEKDLDEFLKEVEQVEKMASSATSKESVLSTNAAASLPTHLNIPPPMPPILTGLPSKTGLPPNPAPFPVLLNPMGLLNNPHHFNSKRPNMPPRLPGSNQQASKHNPLLAGRFPAPPARTKEPEKIVTSTVSTSSSTIEAKPKLRNLSADVTKFLPTSLRIKRQDNKRPINPNAGLQSFRQPIVTKTNKPMDNQANKDTAYEEFMKELGMI